MKNIRDFDGGLKTFDDENLLAFEMPGFLKGALGIFEKTTAKVLQTGQKYGAPMPLDGEIRMLRSQRDELKKMRYRADSEIRNNVSKWKASSELALKQLADQLNQEGGRAIAKQSVTNQYYARAIVSAQNLQAALIAGKSSAQLSAKYAVEKKLALQEGGNTKRMFENFFAGIYKVIEQAQGFSGYLTEARVSAKDMIRQAREQVERVVPSIKKFAPWATPLMIGGGVLLALNFMAPALSLLRRRRS